MSKYKPYPKYKDSGVEWLGDIPAEWSILRLKYICRFAYGDALSQETRCEGHIPVYGSNGVVGVHDSPNTKAPVVIVGRKGSFGRVSYSERPAFVIDTAYFVDKNTTTQPLRWIYYLLQTLELDAISKDTGVPGLSREDAYSKIALLPKGEELDTISAFLDHEVAHIDTIISKQEHLINLLEEKRISIISHAVTKGLNPDAPMKDSGVEWLGNMAFHWKKSNVKFAINSIEQGWSPQCYSREAIDEEYGVLKVGCVNGGNFDEQENKALPIELPPELQYEIKEGDVLISRANVRSLVGGIAIVRNLTKKLLLCDKLYRVSLRECVDKQFFVYALSSGMARFQYERNSTGASDTMQNVSQETVKNLCILLPPLNEQKTIVAYLEHELSKIDAIISKTRQAIALAKERRTAIISAAVTGKICVASQQKAEKPLSKSREYFQKVVLAAEITDQLHTERTFGRVKLQKILYLSEYHAQLPFQRSEYQRYAAGPHDPKAMYSIEGQMKKQKWFDSRLRESGYGKEYVPLERHEAYKRYYERYFAEKHEVIQRLIDLLRPKDTQFCEVVATLYGVWNDFLLEGQQPDDAAMFKEAVTNWAPEKKKVPSGLWPKALHWMRENNLVPCGWGEPTIHRQEA